VQMSRFHVIEMNLRAAYLNGYVPFNGNKTTIVYLSNSRVKQFLEESLGKNQIDIEQYTLF
jgi:hypothetical protein